jgi:hypothetical protein
VDPSHLTGQTRHEPNKLTVHLCSPVGHRLLAIGHAKLNRVHARGAPERALRVDQATRVVQSGPGPLFGQVGSSVRAGPLVIKINLNPFPISRII